MAKNDMEVIMYKILRYLYECMKLGVEPELEQFAWNSKLFDIPQSYWCKIIVTLVRKGYITGFATVYKGNIIKNLIMDCQSYTKYRPNETTGGIFVSWRRKEELPTGA